MSDLGQQGLFDITRTLLQQPDLGALSDALTRLVRQSALADSAARLGHPAHTGVVHCKDSFYGQHSPEASPVAPWLKLQWQAWLKGGCLASEMESAALFILAASLGVRAGCVLTAIWNQERAAAGLSNPRCEDSGPAVETALEALRILMDEETAEIRRE